MTLGAETLDYVELALKVRIGAASVRIGARKGGIGAYRSWDVATILLEVQLQVLVVIFGRKAQLNRSVC